MQARRQLGSHLSKLDFQADLAAPYLPHRSLTARGEGTADYFWNYPTVVINALHATRLLTRVIEGFSLVNRIYPRVNLFKARVCWHLVVANHARVCI